MMDWLYHLYGFLRHVFENCNLTGLTNSESPRDRLHLCRRIILWLNNVDVVGIGQIEPA